MNYAKVSQDFVNNIESDIGWWYTLLLLSIKLDYKLLDILSNTNAIFGMHLYTIALFWLEAR